MPVRIRSLFRSMLVQAASVAGTLAILGGMSAPVKANTALYTVTDLGSLGWRRDWIWESSALALNNAGDVVETTTSPTDPSMTLPFIYRDGTMTAITDWTGEARGINDAGQVTGGATPPGEIMPRAFMYQNGEFTDLGALPGYSNQPYAVGCAINSSGMIVGDSKSGALIYENGAARPNPEAAAATPTLLGLSIAGFEHRGFTHQLGLLRLGREQQPVRVHAVFATEIHDQVEPAVAIQIAGPFD